MLEKAKNFTLAHPRLKKLFGVFLLSLGLLALVTPLTPGATLFIVLGCEFIGLQFIFLEKIKKGFLKWN